MIIGSCSTISNVVLYKWCRLMSEMTTRRRYVLIILVSFVMVMVVEARPSQSITSFPNTHPNITSTTAETAMGEERILTSVRILSKPTLHRRGGAPVKLQDNTKNHAIIFPDSDIDDTVVVVPSRLKGKPSCAKGMTFCEKVDGYPEDLVNKVFKQPTGLDNFFGVDDGPDEIANRLGGGDDLDISLCQSVQKMIYPKIGKTKSNKWKYIVNQENSDKYVQGVRVEICSDEGKPCSLLSDLPLGYTTTCKQKYVNRRLISFTESGDTSTDVFEMPSTCCCTYRKNIEILTRFGTDII